MADFCSTHRELLVNKILIEQIMMQNADGKSSSADSAKAVFLVPFQIKVIRFELLQPKP